MSSLTWSSDSSVRKIGLTGEDPGKFRDRLNASESQPFPIILEFAKCVNWRTELETSLTGTLSYELRHGSVRGFWKISGEKVHFMFGLIEGIWWSESSENKEQMPLIVHTSVDPDLYPAEESDEDSDQTDSQSNERKQKPPVNGYSRTMWECLKDGYSIRHRGSLSTIWQGKYNATKNAIISFSDGKEYNSPSGFSKAHYKSVNWPRQPQSNGWDECEYWDSDVDVWKKIGFFKVATQ